MGKVILAKGLNIRLSVKAGKKKPEKEFNKPVGL
jgi:hypothetical protein